ncbi:hypothetical protein Hanom_Chr15g01359071 [Helianthus anomalus]
MLFILSRVSLLAASLSTFHLFVCFFLCHHFFCFWLLTNSICQFGLSMLFILSRVSLLAASLST